MDQSSVSPNSKKQFSFPIRKRNYKGKPVVPSPQLDYHNESMFSLFKDINDKKDNTDSKPNEEHDGRNNCWSFQEYGNRKFQISIQEETILEETIHIEKIPEMIKEALLFEPTVGSAQLVIDESVFQPTDVEEKTKFDVFWEVSETAPRKVCVTRIFSQDDPNRCYFTIKLFTRGTGKDCFRRKYFLSVRIGEMEKLHRMREEIVSVLNKVKNQKRSQSA